MAHFNFVISQNAKWGHAGFYIDCHRMTVPENILLQKKHWFPVRHYCKYMCALQPLCFWEDMQTYDKCSITRYFILLAFVWQRFVPGEFWFRGILT